MIWVGAADSTASKSDPGLFPARRYGCGMSSDGTGIYTRE
jgi:hypothetical protein